MHKRRDPINQPKMVVAGFVSEDLHSKQTANCAAKNSKE